MISVSKKQKGTDSFTIPLMAVYQLGKYISGMNNKKSFGPEEIGNQLHKLASPYIAGTLTYIFNFCIEQIVFPSELQEAISRFLFYLFFQ